VSPGEIVKGGRVPGKFARRLQRLILERRYRMRHGALRDVDLREIGFDAPGRVYEHIPSPWGVLGRILRRGDVTSEDVFLDFGCGMGPVLIEAAARYDFRRVIGIDVVPEFTAVAEDTVARARDRLRCQQIEVVTADALAYEVPDDVTIVYMCDPFRAQVFEAAIGRMIASIERNPRQLRLVYSMPVEGARLERMGAARLVRYGRRPGRPWATAPDLAMYEINPSGDGDESTTPGPPGTIASRLLPALARNGERPPAPGGGDVEVPKGTIELATSHSASGSGVKFAGSSDDLDALRGAFERQHCVRLPGFLAGPLLERIQGYVSEGEFSTEALLGGRSEVTMEDGKAPQLLMLLMNDPRLFELVRAITGCAQIASCDASLYRVMPGREHADRWHGEIFGHRMIVISVDLSERPYSGGVLEIRDRHSHQVLHRAVDTEPGDAMLIRSAPSVQHRVTPVEGDSPRTVYAGWFMRRKSSNSSKLARPGTRG
jgi:SAM-dependent methyltransferase